MTSLTLVVAGYDVKYLCLASVTVLVYDWLLMLDKEVEFFWSGLWGISRILYLANRYLPPFSIVLALCALFLQNPTSIVGCHQALVACFVLNFTSMAVIQGILVVRIWYIWTHSKFIRIFAVVTFCLCTAATAATLANFLGTVRFDGDAYPYMPGCSIPPPTDYWPPFLPVLILHSILFLLTVLRAWKSTQALQDTPLLLRLLRDGGLFYFVVFVSVGYIEIGAFMTEAPKINMPAVFSSFTLVICSVSMSRVMLSIRSLAAELSVDPSWMLNNAELSRVHWRRGPQGELLVDVDVVEGVDVSMNRIATPSRHSRHSHESDMHVECEILESNYYGGRLSSDCKH